MAVAASAAPRASERAGIPGAGQAAASPRASLSRAGGTRAAARGPAGPGGPGRRRWRGRAAGAQPAKSPEPSLPPREPGEPRRGCPALSAPCRARLARLRGETCPSPALHRPRLICKQPKVRGAPRALFPRPGARCTWPRAEHRRDGRRPRLGSSHSPPNGHRRGLGGSRGRDAPVQPGANPAADGGRRAAGGAGGEVTQLHLARPGRRGASGNFGDGRGGAGLRVCDVGSRQTPQPRERPTARARQNWGDRGRPWPRQISRFLSLFQTKANWQVRLINFGGISPSGGALAPAAMERRGQSEGSCPREMSVSSRGARARSGWHLPGATGRGRRPRVFRGLGIPSQTGTGVGNQPRLQTQLSRLAGEPGQEGGGSPRAGPGPGQRLEPKVKSKSLRLAGSCSGFPAGISIARIKSLSP